MKITLSFKTPSVVADAVDSMRDFDCDDDYEDAAAEAKEACKKWVEYGECIFVDVDTEDRTAVVRVLIPDPAESGSPVGLPGVARGTGTVRRGP